eukprot:jgi/Botrbrau1/13660/Bobra.0292s0009.1
MLESRTTICELVIVAWFLIGCDSQQEVNGGHGMAKTETHPLPLLDKALLWLRAVASWSIHPGLFNFRALGIQHKMVGIDQGHDLVNCLFYRGALGRVSWQQFIPAKTHMELHNPSQGYNKPGFGRCM